LIVIQGTNSTLAKRRAPDSRDLGHTTTKSLFFLPVRPPKRDKCGYRAWLH
jgi:hypothetical protein